MSVTGAIGFVGNYFAQDDTLPTLKNNAPVPTPDLKWTNGNASSQIQVAYDHNFSIVAGGNLTIDLKGGGGEKDALNANLSFLTVNEVVVSVTAPSANTSIRFGPQGVANATQLWFGNVTASFYDTIRDCFAMVDRGNGWSVGNTTKYTQLMNPGNATVAGRIVILGRNT